MMRPPGESQGRGGGALASHCGLRGGPAAYDQAFSIGQRALLTVVEEMQRAGSLCSARRETRQVARDRPSLSLQLTCAWGGDRAGLLLRKLAGLRGARGERVGLALALALVPLLCTCRHGNRGREVKQQDTVRGRAWCVRLHACQVSLQERLGQLGVGHTMQRAQQILELDIPSWAMQLPSQNNTGSGRLAAEHAAPTLLIVEEGAALTPGDSSRMLERVEGT